MRMRSRKLSHKTLLPLAMGVLGLVVFVVAVPPSFLLGLLGLGLMVGAYFLWKSGL
ncbi:MAG TPA: hypothetical protein GXX23_09000 [Firmicutes bacterium]|nr:hypothetical protein [Candidatus Fermentithermobacillaceae bacterium]